MKAILTVLTLTIALGLGLLQFTKPAPVTTKAAPTIESLMIAVPGPEDIVTVAAAVRGPIPEPVKASLEDSIFTNDPKDARISLDMPSQKEQKAKDVHRQLPRPSLKKSDSALFEDLKHETLTAQQRRDLKAAHVQMSAQIENLTREPNKSRNVAGRKAVASRSDDGGLFESKKATRKAR